MNFRTEVELPIRQATINITNKTMFLGSCFAGNIGKRMLQHKLDTEFNPFGPLYNPMSIGNILDVLYEKAYQRKSLHEKYVFNDNGIWRSWIHSNQFGDADKNLFLEQTNYRLAESAERFKNLDVLFLTLGTNHRYILEKEGITVTNCHKQPASLFREETSSVSSIVGFLCSILNNILAANPKLKIVFTVSPYRYTKFGAHGNQLSKSTLLLATEELCTNFPTRCFYFPAYEIVNDELRDYRFYAEDMLHPSQQAISYIWMKFSQCYFDITVTEFIKEWEEIEKALAHKPFNPESMAYCDFLEKTKLKVDLLKKKYPNLVLE